jgi:hypothetical protein
MAARLAAQHPDYWPETIRAMLAALGDAPGRYAPRDA